MSDPASLTCKDDRGRRALTRKASLNGLDYLEVGEDKTELRVYFLGKAPHVEVTEAHLQVRGGRRIRDIRVVGVRIEPSDRDDVDDCMVVCVDRPGDFSTYTLCIVDLDEKGRPTQKPRRDFDPRYACVCFSFKADCPSDLDCAAPPVCDAPQLEEPAIDYLARDYSSFRRLILDRLALLMPDWSERHIPDIGITLVEMLSYVGDQLSYYQDAVATEAYLDTCRQRISVRRHLRLVDYRLHEGCNARVWLALSVKVDLPPMDPRDIYFATAANDLGIVFEPVRGGGEAGIQLHQAHSEIHFYTWGETECCIPRGATAATLIDPGATFEPKPAPGECVDTSAPPQSDQPPDDAYRLDLQPCDVLIFEEVLGPTTGLPQDADRQHRHAVRLTDVTRTYDRLTGQLLVDIEWCREDALPFPLCLSSVTSAPKCETLANVSVAWGNVVLVDHGRMVDEDLGQVPVGEAVAQCEDDCTGAEVSKRPGPFRPRLAQAPVTYAQAVQACVPSPEGQRGGPCQGAASTVLTQDSRDAVAQVWLESYPAAPDGHPAFGPIDVLDPTTLARALASSASDGSTAAAWLRGRLDPADVAALDQWGRKVPETSMPLDLRARVIEELRSLTHAWEPRYDLLGSGPDDRHFVVEIDDERRACLRFGDGDCGRVPDAGESFHASYRVGNGPSGNVGADTLTRIEFRNNRLDDITVRNPMAALGGTAPELVEEAKLRAPHAVRQHLERAITADDYAAVVMRDFAASVQRSAAVLRWNGTGPEVLVAVDAYGTAEPYPELLGRIFTHLERFRRIGHDLRVEAARLVPLEVALTVCVKPGYLRGHIKAALLEALGSRMGRGGRRGFFHPDNLTFGEGVSLSRIVSAAQGVEGVESVQLTQLERLGAGPNGEIEAGLLSLDAIEVAQLDNDPDFPEHGKLVLDLRGGR